MMKLNENHPDKVYKKFVCQALHFIEKEEQQRMALRALMDSFSRSRQSADEDEDDNDYDNEDEENQYDE